jgi:hypothetical protein
MTDQIYDTEFTCGDASLKVRAFNDGMNGWQLAVLTADGQVIEPYRSRLSDEAVQDDQLGDAVGDAISALIERYLNDHDCD